MKPARPKGQAVDVTRLRVALARLSVGCAGTELAGLTPTQLAALATVERAGPMRLGDLAAAEGIAPSTLTRLVTALEDSGYVRRFADPSDARASTLAITPHGHDALDRIRTESTLVLTASLGLLTAAQRCALAEALPVLEQLAGDRPRRSCEAADAADAEGGRAGTRRVRSAEIIFLRSFGQTAGQLVPLPPQRGELLAPAR